MLFKFVVGLVCSIISCPWQAPVEPDYRATPYGPQNWEQAALAREALQGIEDDMRFVEGFEPSYAGINGSTYRWPRKTMVYEFDPKINIDWTLKNMILKAMEHISSLTCIRFRKKSTEKSYVRIFRDKNLCYSNVGCLDRQHQPQNISLGMHCNYTGTIVHEICHSLGLFHEHQRSDRDTYITVFEKNIAPGAKKDFNKTAEIDEMTFGHDYDYASIMHYGECAFSKDVRRCPTDHRLRTMEAKDGHTRLEEPYDKPGLNVNDVYLLNKLYNC